MALQATSNSEHKGEVRFYYGPTDGPKMTPPLIKTKNSLSRTRRISTSQFFSLMKLINQHRVGKSALIQKVLTSAESAEYEESYDR